MSLELFDFPLHEGAVVHTVRGDGMCARHSLVIFFQLNDIPEDFIDIYYDEFRQIYADANDDWWSVDSVVYILTQTQKPFNLYGKLPKLYLNYRSTDGNYQHGIFYDGSSHFDAVENTRPNITEESLRMDRENEIIQKETRRARKEKEEKRKEKELKKSQNKAPEKKEKKQLKRSDEDPFFNSNSSDIMDNNFDLHRLLVDQQKNETYVCPEPSYQAAAISGAKMVSVSMTKAQDVFINDGSLIRKIIPQASQDLKKVRHDIVASNLNSDTDQDIRTIVKEAPYMTPDCIIPGNMNLVLELGTTFYTEVDKLEREFDKKRAKYEMILEGSPSTLYVLIVSPMGVYTNLKLQDFQINAICNRMQKGLIVENEIIKLLGTDIFRDTAVSADESRIEFILSNLITHKNDHLDTENYNRKLMDEFIECDLTDSDRIQAHRILKECLRKPGVQKEKPKEDLEDYFNKFDDSNSKRDQKRVTNFPFVMANRTADYDMSSLPKIDFSESNVPDGIQALWMSVEEERFQRDLETRKTDHHAQSLREAMDPSTAPEKHFGKVQGTFFVKLNDKQKTALALTGYGARKYKEREEILDHVKKSKISFHPDTNTEDIDRFIHNNTLVARYPSMTDKLYLKELLETSKKLAGQFKGNIKTSTDIWFEYVFNSGLVGFADQISSICQELGYAYRHKVRDNHVIYKRLRHFPIGMIIKTTGTHVFVSFAIPIDGSRIIDTGRLGPEIYTTKNYYITDMVSYNEVTLEHFVKAGPYMAAIMTHIMSHCDLDILKMEQGQFFSIDSNRDYWTTVKTLFLTFLVNKTDCEEILTSQRYLFMKLLEDRYNDPYSFVKRLPSMIKSRMTCYFLRKTVCFMHHYSENPVVKVIEPQSIGHNSINYKGIRSLFQKGDISMEKKINEFYFGYVVSKVKGRGSDQSSQIVKKILKEEYLYKDNGSHSWSYDEPPSENRVNKPLLKWFLICFNDIMAERLSTEYRSIMKREIIREFAYANFSKLATLKASARSHDVEIKPLDEIPKVSANVRAKLKKENPAEFERRPKMIEAISLLVETYKKDKGITKDPDHIFEIVPYCLDKLEDKGGFDSDIFAKSQHGGNREIHVLECKARVVQFFVEMIARILCSKFKSETITHPEEKEKFVRDHYKDANITFAEFITICKSADAERWCQRNFGGKFAAFLLYSTDKIFHPLIYRVLRLWVHKKISFPMELVSIFLANKSTTFQDPTINRMKNEFYDGTGVFMEKCSNKIKIESGMFQGILHYCSSAFHTMIQEVCKRVIIHVLDSYGLKSIVTIVQGSDDSGCMISIELGASKGKSSKVFALIMFKEFVSEYLSIFCSIAKTNRGSFDLIEYNSEWFFRQKLVKPEFRWVSAALETALTDKMVDRFRIFSNTLTQCLEGGASTLECALIQLSQAWLHYKIMGMDTHVLYKDVKELLMDMPNPSLGFYPLDIDCVSGVTGFDFALYKLFMNYPDKTKIFNMTDLHRGVEVEYPDRRSSQVRIENSSVRLNFGKITIWKKVVDSLESHHIRLEDSLKRAEEDPEIIFGRHTKWEEDKVSILLKLFSPGVKQSMSGHQPVIRMMVASAYMFNRPCLVDESINRDFDKDGKNHEKHSLLKVLTHRKEVHSNSTPDVHELFPLNEEYEKLAEFVDKMQKSMILLDDELVRHSKQTIEVFTSNTEDEFGLVEMVKRKWFGHRVVPVSQTAFETYWSIYKKKYPFLHDTIDETKSYLKMNVVELKQFLESVTSKHRKIKLTDTASRSSRLGSTLTRIFWPGKKIRHADELVASEKADSLRSTIFCLLTYFRTHAATDQILSKQIQDAELLKEDIKSLPPKLQRLKIMHDWLNGEAKETIIQRIYRMKLGTLGFFSIRQTESNGRKVGKGQWRGSVLGLDCLINLDGERCTSITIKQINDINLLGQALRNLLNEFRVNWDFMPAYSTGLYLTSQGRIINPREMPSQSISINIDKEIKIDNYDLMNTNVWELTTFNQTIRLILLIPNVEKGKAERVTILNDSFYARDWDQDLRPAFYISTAFEAWCKGRECSLETMKSEFSNKMAKDSKTFKMYMRRVRTRRDANVSDVSHIKFSKALLNSMELKTETNEHLKREADEIAMVAAQNLDFNNVEFQKFLQTIESNTLKQVERADLGNIGDWIEAGVDEDEESGPEKFANFIPDQADLDLIIEALSKTDASVVELQEIQARYNKGMPKYNKFWYPLLTLIRGYGFENRDELITNAKQGKVKTDGMLAVILSFTLQVDCFEEIERQGSDYKSLEALTDLGTVDTRDTWDDDTPVDVIKDQLIQYSDALESDVYNPMIKELILKKAIQTQRMLDIRLRSHTVGSLEKIPYMEFMTTVMRECVFEELVEDYSDVSENISETIVLYKKEMHRRISQMYKSGYITEDQSRRYLSSVKINQVSAYLIESISLLTNSRVVIAEGGMKIFECFWESEVNYSEPYAIVEYDMNGEVMITHFVDDAKPAEQIELEAYTDEESSDEASNA